MATGKITRTDPLRGVRTPVGSTVKFWVSTGPAQVQVPRLTGRTEDDARATLGSAGLLVKEPPGSRCSDDVEVGQVAKQTPAVGTLVKRNTAVSFDVANSPCTVDVPSVREPPGRPGAPEPPGRDDRVQEHQRRGPDRHGSGAGRNRARPGHRGHERQALQGHDHGGAPRSGRRHHRRSRDRAHTHRRRGGRALLGARDLARLGALGDRRARPGSATTSSRC